MSVDPQKLPGWWPQTQALLIKGRLVERMAPDDAQRIAAAAAEAGAAAVPGAFLDGRWTRPADVVVGVKLARVVADGGPIRVGGAQLRTKPAARLIKLLDGLAVHLPVALRQGYRSSPVGVFLVACGPAAVGCLLRGTLVTEPGDGTFFGYTPEQERHSDGIQGELLACAGPEGPEVASIDPAAVRGRGELWLQASVQ